MEESTAIKGGIYTHTLDIAPDARINYLRAQGFICVCLCVIPLRVEIRFIPYNPDKIKNLGTIYKSDEIDT
jgi:hypothetical protein